MMAKNRRANALPLVRSRVRVPALRRSCIIECRQTALLYAELKMSEARANRKITAVPQAPSALCHLEAGPSHGAASVQRGLLHTLW